MPANQSRRNLLKYLSLTAVSTSALSVSDAYAKKPIAPVYTTAFSNNALQGHDAVAYFLDGKPVPGDKQYRIEHAGARWLFASDENRQMFVDDPEKYAPQFGGYCAFSVAKNKIVKGDAELFAIVDDKLYVNYNRGIHKLWMKRPETMIEKARGNWPTILG